MPLIYTKDLIPILISYFVFSMLATAHRVLLPVKYSAFLQFKEDEDVSKTIQSSIVRIIYLITGTCILNAVVGYTEKQIGIGIFIACFLNVWPAIIQNHLLKIRKNRTEWLLLMGYIAFIGVSIIIEIVTIRLFLPVLREDMTVYWLDNQAITFFLSLILMVVPVTLEIILAKFARIVMVQTIDTFVEEVYILERQLNMECVVTEKNKYLIDRVARENDINVVLLETVLKLEYFYRGQIYNRVLENLLCKCVSKLAIKKDISVGLGQIKISTAEKVLQKDAHSFIKNICEDKLNVEVCAKLLKILIEDYESRQKIEYYKEVYEDVYDYIACEYLGAHVLQKNKTALIYSAVLRSVMEEEVLYYMGSDLKKRYSVYMFKQAPLKLNYEKFQEFVESLPEDVMIQKEIFIEELALIFEFVIDDKYYIYRAEQFARENNCEFELLEKQ